MIKVEELLRRAYNGRSKARQWPTYSGGLLDRNNYVSASEVGRCLRQLGYSKQLPEGRDGSLNVNGYSERGHAVEAWVCKLFDDLLDQNSKWVPNYYGAKQVSFTYGNMSGTPDVIFIHKSKNTAVVGDIKSFDPRKNRASLVSDKHIDQVQQNMFIVDMNLPISVKYGFLLYINASDFSDMVEHEVWPDRERVSRLVYRADLVMGTSNPDELPAEGMWTKGGCDYCVFTERCSEKVAQKERQDEAVNDAERALRDVFR